MGSFAFLHPPSSSLHPRTNVSFSRSSSINLQRRFSIICATDLEIPPRNGQRLSIRTRSPVTMSNKSSWRLPPYSYKNIFTSEMDHQIIKCWTLRHSPIIINVVGHRAKVTAPLWLWNAVWTDWMAIQNRRAFNYPFWWLFGLKFIIVSHECRMSAGVSQCEVTSFFLSLTSEIYCRSFIHVQSGRPPAPCCPKCLTSSLVWSRGALLIAASPPLTTIVGCRKLALSTVYSRCLSERAVVA